MTLLSTILIYVNSALALAATVHFFFQARSSGIMKPVLTMLGINCLIMFCLYLLLIFKVVLPDITGRINLTLVLLTLNVSGLLLNERYKT